MVTPAESDLKSRLYGLFPCKLRDVLDAPEPLRGAMLAALGKDDAVDLLILAPDSRSGRGSPPPSLLAVQPSGWIFVSGSRVGQCRTVRATFEDTLRIELTRALLFGCLRLTRLHQDRSETVEIEFNAVMTPIYQEAAQSILDGIDDISILRQIDDRELGAKLSGVPVKFASAVRTYRPASRKVIEVLHWPAVNSGRLPWTRRELVPSGALVLAERCLIWISDEKRRPWELFHSLKIGSIVTYFPLTRLSGHGIERRDGFDSLE